jgi:hypothetical protein
MNTMTMPGLTAATSLYKTSRHYQTGRHAITTSTGILPQARRYSKVVPQLKLLCGPCHCATVGGCGVPPFNPGWQTCLHLNSHGSWNPLNWSLDATSEPCFGAT